MSREALLQDLLLKSGNSSLAQRCLQALSSRVYANYESTGPVPIGEIRDIYLRRARLNEKRNGPVEGFDELVPELEAATEDSVVVHGFEAGREAFTIFTNASVTRLIGLLLSHIK